MPGVGTLSGEAAVEPGDGTDGDQPGDNTDGDNANDGSERDDTTLNRVAPVLVPPTGGVTVASGGSALDTSPLPNTGVGDSLLWLLLLGGSLIGGGLLLLRRKGVASS
ncbi:MAG: LPXTG cell wall anchor domain-containing protein [Nocardioidaceae bacterium]